MRIDLHTHSTASDGTDSPAELIRAAAARDIDVIAITDHDTTAGWDEAFAAHAPGVTVVPGVEFSCVHHPPEGRRISLHLLGYFFDEHNVGLQDEWARLRQADGREPGCRRLPDHLGAGAPAGSLGRDRPPAHRPGAGRCGRLPGRRHRVPRA